MWEKSPMEIKENEFAISSEDFNGISRWLSLDEDRYTLNAAKKKKKDEDDEDDFDEEDDYYEEEEEDENPFDVEPSEDDLVDDDFPDEEDDMFDDEDDTYRQGSGSEKLLTQ